MVALPRKTSVVWGGLETGCVQEGWCCSYSCCYGLRAWEPTSVGFHGSWWSPGLRGQPSTLVGIKRHRSSGLSPVGFGIQAHFVVPCGFVFCCLWWVFLCSVKKRSCIYSWWMWSHNTREESPFLFFFFFLKERSDYFKFCFGVMQSLHLASLKTQPWTTFSCDWNTAFSGNREDESVPWETSRICQV